MMRCTTSKPTILDWRSVFDWLKKVWLRPSKLASFSDFSKWLQSKLLEMSLKPKEKPKYLVISPGASQHNCTIPPPQVKDWGVFESHMAWDLVQLISAPTVEAKIERTSLVLSRFLCIPVMQRFEITILLCNPENNGSVFI